MQKSEDIIIQPGNRAYNEPGLDGIEPSLAAYETAALPLHHRPISGLSVWRKSFPVTEHIGLGSVKLGVPSGFPVIGIFGSGATD